MQHYLIVNPERRSIVHHRRTAAGAIETRILHDDAFALDSPGLVLAAANFFPVG